MTNLFLTNPHAISEEIITFHTFVLHPKMLVKKYFTVTGSWCTASHINPTDKSRFGAIKMLLPRKARRSKAWNRVHRTLDKRKRIMIYYHIQVSHLAISSSFRSGLSWLNSGQPLLYPFILGPFRDWDQSGVPYRMKSTVNNTRKGWKRSHS